MKNKKPLLIVVDYQNDFVDQRSKIAKKLGIDLSACRKIFPVIQKLIEKWHIDKHPVLFLLNDYSSNNYKGEYKKHRSKTAYGDTAIEGTWGHELYNIKMSKNDKSIVKNFPNGFANTDLEEVIKKIKPTSIYFVGVNTDVCVFHTAFHASFLGYKIFVVEDGTATSNNKMKNIFLDYLHDIAGVHIIKSKLILKK